MFGISMWEVLLILVLALILLGPRQLTETARVLGRIYRELQRITWDVRNAIDLDAPDRPPSAPTPPVTKSGTTVETPRPLAVDYDLYPTGGKKTGPDFYGDLLASSKKEEPPTEPKTKETAGDTAAQTEAKESEVAAAAPTDAPRPVPDPVRKESG